MRRSSALRYCVATLAMLLVAIGVQISGSPNSQGPATAGAVGNVDTLKTAYGNWKIQNLRAGNSSKLVLPLNYVKGLASRRSLATGTAFLDFASGMLTVEVTGLSKTEHDVWLVDNRAGSGLSVRPEPQDRRIHLGALESSGAESTLRTHLDSDELAGFELDLIVIARAGADPESATVLTGSPTLFQRMYFSEQRGRDAGVSSAGESARAVGRRSRGSRSSLAKLIPVPARARTRTHATTNPPAGNPLATDVPTGGRPDPLDPMQTPGSGAGSVPQPLDPLQVLIAEGEALFNNETFSGNGRTCSTCHAAENNFTLDPAFIATLPPNDPLFVAEFNPDLAELENPTLMRQFGLIRANIDGFEDPTNKFVMRGVQHMLGMAVSVQTNRTDAPFDMTGWSGDGAPGSGTLRDFATGAVIQHFPKTLGRVDGVDFRLPTDAELDAIEAFTFSLGRRQDLEIDQLHLTDPAAETGRILYMTEDSQNQTVQAAKCNVCHGNAGARSVSGNNLNLHTGVEDMLHPADLLAELRPRDEGFGTNDHPSTVGFGDGTFNTQPLWEAADTAPFFHHNGATTLEDAIAFYDSPEFKQSLEGQRLLLQDSGGQELSIDIDALAAFLRVINALENIRSSTDYLTRATVPHSVAGSAKLLALAQADLEDALEVLAQGELHEEDGVVPHLEASRAAALAATTAVNTNLRDYQIALGVAEATAARDLMADSMPVPDTTKPAVAIVSPAHGETVSASVTITADATDGNGVASVIFEIDGQLIGEANTAPFDLIWDTTTFPIGTHQVTATAVDLANNIQTTSITVTSITAPDTVKPTVAITAPGTGEDVVGSVTITADATDDVGVAKVVFEIDSVAIGEDLEAPFELVWDTTAFPEGATDVTAVAFDLSDNSESTSITVTVDNVVDTPCTVYSCPDPPDPPDDIPDPPDSTVPSGSSPDGEFEGPVLAVDVVASTVTVETEDGPLTLTISDATVFNGSIVSNIHEVLIGHIAQGEFFQSVGEALWIEFDMPPGL